MKIEAGRLDLRPEPTSVAQVMEGVFLVYSVAASRKNLLLMRAVDPRISPALIVDPLRLRQILNNFASNAIKFTAEGHVEIRAELLERRGAADNVRFSVTDTGIGISPENQQKLFQPFVQAEGDTTRRFGGTGLGLAICRRLADMMGGTIEMQSALGKGTTMTLTLTLPIGDPAQVAAADALRGPAHTAAHLAAPARGAQRSGRGGRGHAGAGGGRPPDQPQPARAPAQGARLCRRDARRTARRRWRSGRAGASASSSPTATCPRWTATT